jgi:hypothetical protein
MANPMKGEARLGDLTLSYTFGTFCELEERTGKKVPELLAMLEEGIGFSDLRVFIWAGLLKYHPQSEEDVTALLDDIGFNPAVIALRNGVNSFFGEPEKEKGKNPRKAA